MKFNQVNYKSAYEWLREKQALLVEVYKKRRYFEGLPSSNIDFKRF